MSKGKRKRVHQHERPRDGRDVVERYELDEPITCYGREIQVLEFEKPRAGTLRQVEQHEGKVTSQSIALIAILADLPEKAVERLSIQDFQAICDEVIDPFFAARDSGDAGDDDGDPEESSPPSTGDEDS